MNEWFAFHVEGHIDYLKEVQSILSRIQTIDMPGVDACRLEDAKRRLRNEIEAFEKQAEDARLHEGVAS